MVAATQFGTLLDILGARQLELHEETKYWNLYSVKFPTPAGKVLGRYLYLASDCPVGEASSKNLSRWKSHGPYTVVATTRSRLAQDIERTREVFRGNEATTPRKLLIENLMPSVIPSKKGIESYEYFVEPELKIDEETTKPALSWLVNLLTSNERGDGSPVCAYVLLAPAGLGKTTLCRAIANSILKSRPDTIPILVESAQWEKLINLSLPNVLNAALLQLLPDAAQLTNPKVFQLLVREQLLVPIFDGFDELSLHPSANLSPTSLLRELLDLVGDAGARVLITARDTFWAKHVKSLVGKDLSRLQPVTLQGFSNAQRQTFFSKRLKDPADRDMANRISREIGTRLYQNSVDLPETQRHRTSGVPLMLELIALNVDRNPSATFAPKSHDSLGPLLEAVCERENVRQKLNIHPEKQMLIFEELFRDYDSGIPREDVKLYVEMNVSEITLDAMERFESHAFFSTDADNNLIPRFETLRMYFVARWLSNRLEAASDASLDDNATNVLGRHATGSSDIFDHLVSLFMEHPKDKALAIIKHAYEMISSRSGWTGACSALFHLSQRLAHEFGKTKEERIAFIEDVFCKTRNPPIIFEKFAVQGQISGFDFSNITFNDCEFRNAEFHNCRFNDSTVFNKVNFAGMIRFVNCTGASDVSLLGCDFSAPALEAWDAIQGRSKARSINEDTAKDAVRRIMRKFVNQFGFSTITDENRDSGPILRNPCKDKAWDALLSGGFLDRHHISGVTGGGLHVVDDPEIRHEIRNFLDNAALGPRLKAVLNVIIGHV